MYKTFSSGLIGFPGRALADDIPLAVKYGYEGIMIDIKKDSITYSPSELSDLLKKNKLKFGGFGLPVEFRKDDAVYNDDLKKLRGYCDFAKKTGNYRCSTWLMPCSDTLDYKTNFKQHKERLTPVAKTLEEYGIRLGFEFVGPPSFRKGKAHEFIHDLNGLNELIDAIGTKNLGFMLDVFHWDCAGQVFEDFKKIPGKEWITMAHINDGVKVHTLDKQLDQQQELPGATGVLRVAEFMKGLQNLNYDGPVAVEPFNAVLKAMPFEDAVKAAKTAMDKVWSN